MIEFTSESHDHIVIAKASGKITVADYQNIIIPKLDSIIAKYGKTSALFEIDNDFSGWELQAAFIDFKYALNHRKDFARLALVNPPHYISCLTRMSCFLVTAEIKVFTANERDQALEWING